MTIVRWEPLRELAPPDRDEPPLRHRLPDPGRQRRHAAPLGAGHGRARDGRPLPAPARPPRRHPGGRRASSWTTTLTSPVSAAVEPAARESTRTVPARRARVRRLPPLADPAQGVDPEAITAGFENGVLEVRIPKPEERKPRRIEIGGDGRRRLEGARRRRPAPRHPPRRSASPAAAASPRAAAASSQAAAPVFTIRTQGPATPAPARSSSPTARSRRPPSSRSPPRRSSRRSRCARPPSSASTWCWATRSTSSSRPATS